MLATASSQYVWYSEGQDDVVLIGAILPLHWGLNGQCGAVTSFGVQYAEAVSYTTQRINSLHTFLPGIKLGFEIRDSCDGVNIGLGQTLDFIISTGQNNGKGVSVAIGEWISINTIPIANLLNLFHIPLISFSATASSLSDKSQYGYFLRTVPPDSYQAKALADIMSYFNWTYVIAVNSGDVYGQDGIQEFISIFSNVTYEQCIAGGSPIKIPYPVATPAQYDAAVGILAGPSVVNASVIVLFAQLATAEGLLDAVQRRRERDSAFAMRQFVWVGTDTWTNSLDQKRLNIAQNVIGVVPEELNSTGFDQYFQSLHVSNHTNNPWFAEYWESYFNCSLNGTNPALPRCDVANQRISTTNGYVTDTYLPHCIDAVEAIAYALRNIQQAVCNGSGLCNATRSAERTEVDAVNGSLLLQYLLGVNFTGPSGNSVTFDINGDPPGVYTIKSLQEGTVVTVGTWVSTRNPALSFSKSVEWNNANRNIKSLCSEPCSHGQYREFIAGLSSCCWNCKNCGENSYSDGKICSKCVDGYRTNSNKDGCIPIQISYFGAANPFEIISLVIACLGIAIVAVITFVFLIHFNSEIVKSSSRELIVFLLAGICICYVMPFFFIFKPSPAICAIRRFGVGFGFTTCFSPVLVRVIRIHRIFNRKASIKAPKFLSPQSQMISTALLMLIEVAILVVWMAIERPSIKYIFGTSTGEVTCSENPYVGISITLGYNVILLLLTLYFAFRTRHVPERFNETKFINLTSYTLVIIWVAFVPIYFGTASLGSVFQASSQVLAVVLSASVVLGCLLVPKMYTILLNTYKGSTPQASTKSATLEQKANVVVDLSRSSTGSSSIIKTALNMELDATECMSGAEGHTQEPTSVL